MVTANEVSEQNRGILWCLLPGRAEGHAIVAAVSRGMFLDAARKRAQIIPSQKIMEMIAADLRRDRAAAELNARRWAYAHPPRRGRPFSRRRRSRY